MGHTKVSTTFIFLITCLHYSQNWKMQNNGYAKFWEAIEVHFGRCGDDE